MFITFTGNPLDAGDFQESVTITGVEFQLGVPVEVQPTAAFLKLRGNTHFSVIDDDAADEDSGNDDVVELTKADLVAEAAALGIDIDKRWSAKTIGDKIAAFKGQN